jgi:hypothetical protein
LSRLKECRAVDGMLGSPRRRGRLLGTGAMAMPAAACPGDPAASKWVSFSDPLVSSPLQQKQQRICPRTIFLLPRREVFACPVEATYAPG